MPALRDIDPTDLAVLVRAVPELLGHLTRLADDGLDFVLHVLDGLFGAYDVTITSLRGDLVVATLTLKVRPEDERTRCVLLLIWVRQIRESQDRWWRRIALRQKALGLPELA